MSMFRPDTYVCLPTRPVFSGGWVMGLVMPCLFCLIFDNKLCYSLLCFRSKEETRNERFPYPPT